jgi:hypothetical protein
MCVGELEAFWAPAARREAEVRSVPSAEKAMDTSVSVAKTARSDRREGQFISEQQLNQPSNVCSDASGREDRIDCVDSTLQYCATARGD